MINEDSRLPLPDLNPEWNSGRFKINITRCNQCHLHYNYSRHSEDEYVYAFNDMGNAILSIFPNVEIVGNQDKPSYNGCFDIYLSGLGQIEK